MILKKSKYMRLACFISLAALLFGGNLLAQITVLDADEGKAILAQPDTILGDYERQQQGNDAPQDPNAAYMERL
ncbi:MAG: hypothetical protein J6X55_04915, partial [Victivallales bacterium]|nr:hypothetical protein [Victivallales bacterium]